MVAAGIVVAGASVSKELVDVVAVVEEKSVASAIVVVAVDTASVEVVVVVLSPLNARVILDPGSREYDSKQNNVDPASHVQNLLPSNAAAAVNMFPFSEHPK